MKKFKKYVGIAALLLLALLVTGCGSAAAGTVPVIDPMSDKLGGIGTWPIIGWIATLFGYLMRGIYIVLSKMNIYSATICIVLFTIITKMLLLPLTIKQQKFSKVQKLMTPELQALQKKYENRRDQASMQKMQMEQQAIYDKYGSSMSAGCLPALIQLPVLFALYPVIQYFGHYVPEVLTETEEIKSQFFLLFNSINLSENPSFSFNTIFKDFSWLIPILAGGLQFLTSFLTGSQTGGDDKTANSMKTMLYVMPLMTVFLGFSLPAFLGIYWVVQSFVMVVQQYVINKKIDKIPVEDIIKENVVKQNKKREKKGLPPLSDKANINTRKVGEEPAQDNSAREEQIKASTEYYNSKAGSSGSLFAKANMVKEFNERNEKKKD